MPTFDELPPANSVGDGDELPLSQAGIVRRATRAQLLSGVQPALAVAQGSLLGRLSPGIGAVETLAIGENLQVVDGAITGAPAFNITGLPQSGAIEPGDLVCVGQAGRNTTTPYAAFIGGLSGVVGVDGSGLLASVPGASQGRRIGDALADSATVAAFGAVGDGVTDDSEAFMRAIAGGRPLRLEGLVYALRSNLIFPASTAVIGISGATVLRRLGGMTQGTWITVAGETFLASGVTFDGGGLGGPDAPAVEVSATCRASTFTDCSFVNACGPTLGSGLSIHACAGSRHRLQGCRAEANSLHGIAADGSGWIHIGGSFALSNGGSGIDVADGVSATIVDNVCDGNENGVTAGYWQAPPPFTGSGAPLTISRNACGSNRIWGIAAAAAGAMVCSNIAAANGNLSSGGGVLAWLSGSTVADNVLTGGETGLDCRGAANSRISGNVVTATNVGIAPGGANGLSISDNLLLNNVWGIEVTGFEATRSLVPTGSLVISGNTVCFDVAQGGGLRVLDGAAGAIVRDNAFEGAGSADVSQCLWLHTDTAIVDGNLWNNSARLPVTVREIAGRPSIAFPDIADRILVTAAGDSVQALMTAHQVDTLGQVTYLKVLSGGTGYSTAAVTISGSGVGASASAVIVDGQIAWLVLTNSGSGYGGLGASAAVSIEGDGQGAAAIASVGLAILEGRQLRIDADVAVGFAAAGASPPLVTWTGFDLTIPAGGSGDVEGVGGAWRMLRSAAVDYLLPTGDGGAILRSISGGNLTLRPGAGGTLLVATTDEPGGYVATMGRGSPTGMIAAPPGSEFRNLDGGAGNTLWIKQSGSDADGWAAIG